MFRGVLIGLLLVVCPPVGLIALGIAISRGAPVPGEVSPGRDRTQSATNIASEVTAPSPWTQIDAYIKRPGSVKNRA